MKRKSSPDCNSQEIQLALPLLRVEKYFFERRDLLEKICEL
jgi:hypothetical protein